MIGSIGRVISSKNGDDGFLILTVELDYENKIQVECYCATIIRPIEDDRVILIKINGTGKYACIGILQTDLDEDEGDHIIHSRDTDGNVVAKSHYKNDGTVEHTTDSNIITNVNEDEVILELNDDGTVNLTTTSNVVINVNDDAVIQELNDDGTVNLTCDDTITNDTGGDYDIIATGDINLKPDGDIIMHEGTDYAVRYNELKDQIDQLITDLGTFITLYNTHTHSGVQAGGSSTGNPSATGTNTTADFTNTKVTKVKLQTYAEEIA